MKLRHRMSLRPGTRRPIGAWAGLLVLALVAPARAQESLYSLQFLGISEETGDMRARALGILGIPLDDSTTAVTLNPGSLGALRYMTISIVGGAAMRTARDATKESDRSEGVFPHTRFALPVAKKAVLSVGFLTQRNYRSDFILPTQVSGGFAYVRSFQRKGSLYTIPVGVSGAIGRRLHVGATLDFVLGTVDESWATAGDSLVSLRTRRRDGFGGTTVTLGAVGSPFKSLRIGATWTPSVELDRSTTTTVEDTRLNSGAPPIRTSSEEGKTRIPATYRAGAAFDLGRRMTVAGDLSYRDWGQYEGRLYGAESVGVEARYGGGLEWRPRPGSFFGGLVYRVGGSRAQWPQDLGGEALQQTTINFGTGFDLQDGFGGLDFAVEYARIGALDRNGYEETRWAFMVSLSGQEIWRRRSPRAP